jgi:hypothetical protein
MVTEELGDGDVESAGELEQDGDGRQLGAAFELVQVVRGDSRQIRCNDLRLACSGSVEPNSLPDVPG